MSDAPAAGLERLAGLVERVTFHNEQNGFCVLRLKVKRERELITLIGHTPIVSPGEYASASGQWVTDREHGRQLRTVFVRISPPTPPDRHRAIPCLGHGQQWALILSTADGG
jgi:exodeoxyribonuclease V alpha subunit